MTDAADRLRAQTVGDTVTYVVNRNINYTNICLYHCGFCAFSKGRGAADLRGPAYNLDLDEIARRTLEADAAGATEVCLQGGIHPSFTGETYLDIVRAVKAAVPAMHVHAFSPLEIQHGARTLGLPLTAFLERLQEAGLSTLPGTAAEILDDEIRALICPDKLRTEEWLEVIGAAHAVGLRTTATIMYGHLERPVHWARHLQRLRALQARTGRHHRIRAAGLRAHGGAAVAQGTHPLGSDLARGGADARGLPAGAASADHEHPDLLGQDGCGRAPRCACRPVPTISAARS